MPRGPGAGDVQSAGRERGDHAGADRSRPEGRQGRLVHLDRPCGPPSGSPRPSRRNFPASRCGWSAPAPSACSSASAQEYSSNILAVDVVNPRMPRTSSPGSATAGSRPTCRKTSQFCRRAQGRRTANSPACASRCARSPTTPTLVKAPKRQELCRPARFEMERQDRQGASRLQRHHPDRDLPDRPRPRLGRIREARAAEDHAGAVGDRSAEEARARRARDHGRRRRIRLLWD